MKCPDCVYSDVQEMHQAEPVEVLSIPCVNHEPTRKDPNPMKIKYEVEIEVEREEGKFASRDEISDAIRQEIENLGPSLTGLGADGNSVYDIVEIEVFEKANNTNTNKKEN